MDRLIRCNKCKHEAPESEFAHGRDFFQNQFISGCPKCDNRQSPGDASMRMFGGDRPFVYVGRPVSDRSPLGEVLSRAEEAS